MGNGLKLIEWLGLDKKILSYIAAILLTVVVTVPVTITILGAKEVVRTLDGVVESQSKLEHSLNSVFTNLGERLDVIDHEIQGLKDVSIRTNSIQNGIILDMAKGTPEYPIYQERINSLNQYQFDKWGAMLNE